MIVTWRQTAWYKHGRSEETYLSKVDKREATPIGCPLTHHIAPSITNMTPRPGLNSQLSPAVVSTQSWHYRPESTAAWLYVGSGNLSSSCLHVCVISICLLSHFPSLQLLSTVPVMAFSGKCCFSYLDPKLSLESILSFSFCLFSKL